KFDAGTRPESYMVTVIRVGGEKVGGWSGSGNVDAKNQTTFENIPPGQYFIYGRPNPGNDKEETPHILVDVKGGEFTELVLDAKLPLKDKPLPPKKKETSTDAF